MNIASTIKGSIGVALLFAGSPTLAKNGESPSPPAADVRPSQATVKVDSKALNSSASDKSQGLPNANGEKPGNGNGYGHFKGVGLGHGLGLGHGHDSDPESP